MIDLTLNFRIVPACTSCIVSSLHPDCEWTQIGAKMSTCSEVRWTYGTDTRLSAISKKPFNFLPGPQVTESLKRCLASV